MVQTWCAEKYQKLLRLAHIAFCAFYIALLRILAEKAAKLPPSHSHLSAGSTVAGLTPPCPGRPCPPSRPRCSEGAGSPWPRTRTRPSPARCPPRATGAGSTRAGSGPGEGVNENRRCSENCGAKKKTRLCINNRKKNKTIGINMWETRVRAS